MIIPVEGPFRYADTHLCHDVTKETLHMETQDGVLYSMFWYTVHIYIQNQALRVAKLCLHCFFL